MNKVNNSTRHNGVSDLDLDKVPVHKVTLEVGDIVELDPENLALKVIPNGSGYNVLMVAKEGEILIIPTSRFYVHCQVKLDIEGNIKWLVKNQIHLTPLRVCMDKFICHKYIVSEIYYVNDVRPTPNGIKYIKIPQYYLSIVE